MARASETDPINQLEENLQCSVCLGILKDPRTLPCFHSFCKDCLEGVVKTCRDKAVRDGRPIRTFPCPDCRSMFTLEPDKHVADMPRNHFICNMVQVTAVLDRGTRVPCSHNCSQSSVARCVTCEKFLCRECLTVHNNYRGHNGHCVLTMEELSKPENRAKIKGKMYCNEHSGKTLKIYCESCDQLICKHCMDFRHVKQNHSCLLVKDVASNYKELLASNNKAMEDALVEGNLFLKQLSLATAQLDSNANNAKNEIVQRRDAMAKKVVAMLDQKARTLVNKVGQIYKDKRETLDKQTMESKLYVENIKQSVQLSKKLFDQGTEEEIISSQKMMLDNANNLLKKRSEYFKATMPAVEVNFTSCARKEPLNKEIWGAMANSFGEVNDDVATAKQDNVSNTNTKAADVYVSYTPYVSTSSKSTKQNNVSNTNTKAADVYVPYTRYVSTSSKSNETLGTNDKECRICLSPFKDKKTLDKCGPSFCGPLIGNRPPVKMIVSSPSGSVPGYERCGSITITKKFKDGIQGPDHPNPVKSNTKSKPSVTPCSPTENNTNTKNNSQKRTPVPLPRQNKPGDQECRQISSKFSTPLVKQTQTNHRSLWPIELNNSFRVDQSTVATKPNKENDHDTTAVNSTKMITTDSGTTGESGNNDSNLENGTNTSNIDAQNATRPSRML